jgi:hypothetical protein
MSNDKVEATFAGATVADAWRMYLAAMDHCREHRHERDRARALAAHLEEECARLTETLDRVRALAEDDIARPHANPYQTGARALAKRIIAALDGPAPADPDDGVSHVNPLMLDRPIGYHEWRKS